MFFSLVQTLVCVLLIKGGLYALHLSGNGGGAGGGSEGSRAMEEVAAANRMLHALHAVGQQSLPHHSASAASSASAAAAGKQQQHAGAAHRSAAAAAFDATTGRLNQEIADMAQLERERLMLLGLAKQTAESPAVPAGHHGRPIIAGRIQMQPTEELDVGDYPALLQQAARGFMFGSVQKQPPVPLPADEDYEELREFGRRPAKYDYGRVVQPADRDEEQQQVAAAAAMYDAQHNFDFDDLIELEQANEHAEDDLLADLDGYQYHGWEDDAAENPYHALEQLELNAPDALQQLFEQEQRDAPAKSHAGKTQHANSNYNIRNQQKWARKRAQVQTQSQPQLQRNIFGHHFKQQQQQQHNKLALANSEAMANKQAHANENGNNKAATRSGATAAATATKNNEKSTQSMGAGQAQAGSGSAGSQQLNKQPHESTAGDAQQQKQQSQQQPQNKKETEQQQQLLHPNHKRSGSAGGYSAPPVSHSIASQLMLRTARGQRQYDVPQIECPTAMDGMERFACPTPDLQGRYRCIDDHVLCDGFIDCPEGEDEDRRSCMFYKTTKAHLDVLADALLRWARGR